MKGTGRSVRYVYILFIRNRLVEVSSTSRMAISSRDRIIEGDNFYSLKDTRIVEKVLNQ